jgi:hypothetical protein
MSNTTKTPVPGSSYTIPKEAIREHNHRVQVLRDKAQVLMQCAARSAALANTEIDFLTEDNPYVLRNISITQQDSWMWQGLLHELETLQFCPPADQVLRT